MPRIYDDTVDVAFYLYPTEKDARDGTQAGGTGFLVLKPFERLPERGALYLVTNKHVVQKGHTYVRLNRRDGKRADIFHVDEAEWFPHPGPHDVTIGLGVGNDVTHQIRKHIAYDQLLSGHEAAKQEYDIGIGDDVLMIGRFIGHDGKEINRPSLRFGNISVDVGNLRNTEAGYDEESYAVEMKSKPGYSGSAVLVYALRFSTNRASEKKEFVMCLGVNWGNILEQQPVRDDMGKIVEPKRFVRTPSDMSGVVPSWRIKEAIDSKRVREAVKKIEDREISARAGQRAVVEKSSAEVTALSIDENPKHREDFMSVAKAAARKQKPDDQT